MFDPTQCHDDTLMHADCRIFNTDRNDANILVRRRHVRNEDGAIEGVKLELVPIDHGYAIPDSLEVSRAVSLPLPPAACLILAWMGRLDGAIGAGSIGHNSRSR